MGSVPETPADRRVRRRATRRLAAQTAVLMAGLVVVLTVAAVAIVVHGQQHGADSQLAVAVTRADDVQDPPADTWLTITDGNGTDTTPDAPRGVPDDVALAATVRVGGSSTTYEDLGGRPVQIYTARRTDGRVVQAVLDLTANHAERDRLVRTMILVGALGLVLAAMLGTWLGARAVAPLGTVLAAQRRFVADAGHELRTPLTLLSTRAQLLRRRLRGPGAESALDEARAEADAVVGDSAHLAAILEDLLFSLDLEPDRGHTEEVDLDGVVEAVVGSASAAAAAEGIALERLSNPLPGTAVVTGSPTALRRAVTALVDNAVRHARTRAGVWVGCDGSRVVVDVQDDGTGIDPAVAPHIFARFAGGSHTAAGDAPGSPHHDEAGSDPGGRGPSVPRRRRYGLGLALVAEVAAAHDGRIAVVERPSGTGACLRLTLPGDRRRSGGARRPPAEDPGR